MPPKGFRESATGQLSCPHRDVSCCDACAAAHAEIVEVGAVHFWIADAAERAELLALASTFLPTRPARERLVKVGAQVGAAARRRKVVAFTCQARRRVRWYEHLTPAQRTAPKVTHRIVDQVNECGNMLREGREQAAGICDSCAKGWEHPADDSMFNVFESPAEKARVLELWRKAR